MTPVTALPNHPLIVDDTDQTYRARQLRAFVSAIMTARDLAIQCRSEASAAHIRHTRHAAHLLSESRRHYMRAISYLTSVRGLA